MKKADLARPLALITFTCAPCKHTWKAEPARVAADPDSEHHPHAYFAPCPQCRQECGQAQYERALLKAWANATGPRTPEGIAATSRNLAGHPTPEEAKLTRFNAMQHGLAARTATYYPAKPDGYAFCSACDVDRVWCKAQPACVKRTELFMLHHAAFEQGRPEHLKGIYADMQAGIFALVQQLIQTIIGDGVKITAPQYYTDKDGSMLLATYHDDNGEKHTVYDVQAHPLFRPLGELLSRNNLTLADMGVTQKVIEDRQEEMGRLASQDASRELVGDFLRNQDQRMRALEGLFRQAAVHRDSDPVLLEHRAEGEG